MWCDTVQFGLVIPYDFDAWLVMDWDFDSGIINHLKQGRKTNHAYVDYCTVYT